MRRAVFLDRDGVINRTYLRDGKQRAPESVGQFEFLPGVEEAVARLRASGLLAIVVTNQPDVARGWQTRERVDEINAHVRERLRVDDLLACFHVSADACSCRKPKPGMLLEAAARHGIDLPRSFMVGDRLTDTDAGKSAGCTTILIGEGAPDSEPARHSPDLRATSLLDAVPLILPSLDSLNLP